MVKTGDPPPSYLIISMDSQAAIKALGSDLVKSKGQRVSWILYTEYVDTTSAYTDLLAIQGNEKVDKMVRKGSEIIQELYASSKQLRI